MSPTIKLPPDYSVEIKKKYLSHPFSENTFKLKRNLLFISFFSIILKLYELEITTIPWLNIEVPANSPNLLEGVLAVFLIYLTFVFVVNFIYDFKIWNLKINKDNYDWTTNKLKEIDRNIELIASNKENKKIDEIIESVNNFGSYIQKIRNKIRITNRWIITFSMLRLFFIDITIPLIFSILALIKIGNSSLQIFTNLFF